MGLLAQAIYGSRRAVSADERRASIIERNVCRRLGTSEDSERLGQLEVSISTIAGGRRSIEVVAVREPGAERPLAMYGVKAPHGSEPSSAEKAAALGIGPAVFDVSEDGVVLEEFFPERLNVRHRELRPDEHGHYGRQLSRFFVAFIRVAEGELLCHKDPRPEHIFIVGQGEEIQVRLIDWGRATTWPLERFHEWAARQFSWLYEYASFYEPAIWKAFADGLVEDIPETPGHQALSEAYAEFVQAQAARSDRTLRRSLGTRFLEFIVACGKLDLNGARLNEFVEKHKSRSGEELARAYSRLENS